MRLQVSLTVGDQTHQAGLQGLQFGSGADVTGNFSWFGCLWLSAAAPGFLLSCLSELSSHLREQRVDVQLRSRVEYLFTHRTQVLVIGIPVFSDAVFAEVVST